MTLFDAINDCINGPCTASCDDTGGMVAPGTWAALIEQAVKEWAGVHALEAPLVAVLIEQALFPLHEEAS